MLDLQKLDLRRRAKETPLPGNRAHLREARSSGTDSLPKLEKSMTHEEENLQIRCVTYFSLQYPKLERLLHHSPNGGRREIREAARFKRMGTRAGFPDLILLQPAGKYPYLAVELKTVTGDQEDRQKEYQKLITEAGGLYVVIRTFEDFQAVVNAYLQGKEIPELKAPKRKTPRKAKLLFEDEKPKRRQATTKRSQLLQQAVPERVNVRDFFSKGGITVAVKLQADLNGTLQERTAPVYSFADFLRYKNEGWNFRNWLLNGFRYGAIMAEGNAEPLILRKIE